MTNVSGPSAGIAFTLLAVYALRNEQLKSNFTVTGTITSNDSVGPVGDIYDKVGAAERAGLDYILVPAVQNGTGQDLEYYLAQQRFGIPLVEVSNLTQALQYASAQHAQVSPLTLNIIQSYNLSDIPAASLQCENCSLSYFQKLVNYTFGFVGNEIALIPLNYSAVAAQMQKNLQQYEAISSKEYLYTAADLAFVEFRSAYTLANTGSFTTGSALSLASNISNYCTMLTPPQLTN